MEGVWQKGPSAPAEMGQDRSHPGHLFRSPTLPPLHLAARMLAPGLWGTCGVLIAQHRDCTDKKGILWLPSQGSGSMQALLTPALCSDSKSPWQPWFECLLRSQMNHLLVMCIPMAAPSDTSSITIFFFF